MSLLKLEITYFLRSPVIWIIVALMAFITAWSFLLAVELFTSMQVQFAGMSDAPTIMQGIVFPVIFAQAKLSILIVSIVAGLSFSRLHNDNGWFLILSSPQSGFSTVIQKYFAILTIIGVFLIPFVSAMCFMYMLSDISSYQLFVAFSGLILLNLWMSAFAILISAFINNSGFSILLNMVLLFGMWGMSASVLDDSWGKNWLQTLSPQYHFKQFLAENLSLSSVYFFVSGIVILLWLTSLRLHNKRYKSA